jgi:peptidyl-prolyl cis-trans isomerase B (cyclophilin B)
MMKRLLIWLGLLAALPMMGQQQVVLETTEGNIRIMLYDDTPRHRDNFLRLAGEHFYDSLLFHRVIKRFMIQAGDPTSRYAEPGQSVGEGEVGYTLEPEIFAKDGRLLHYHRRGVVAAAREGDDVNPERRSSGCQFYIVWGTTFSSNDLKTMQERLDTMTNHQVVMTPEMITTYRKVGGTPHLDGQYTVFGEVTEGLDVVERILRVFTDDYDRPVDDVRILRVVLPDS